MFSLELSLRQACYSEIRRLEDLEIWSWQELRGWGRSLNMVETDLTGWFVKEDGWVLPKVRIVDMESGEEMNWVNYREKSESWRGRGRVSSVGYNRGHGRWVRRVGVRPEKFVSLDHDT